MSHLEVPGWERIGRGGGGGEGLLVMNNKEEGGFNFRGGIGRMCVVGLKGKILWW